MPPPTPKSLQPPPCEQNHLHFHSAAATTTRGVSGELQSYLRQINPSSTTTRAITNDLLHHHHRIASSFRPKVIVVTTCYKCFLSRWIGMVMACWLDSAMAVVVRKSNGGGGCAQET
ncbi:hypothetical protein QVD17_30642 [Tagetes erecta]|uniref:Uncharacterized protein n=1 Tax=Tagetes erecta TaxID=13708 RepID=A0AAD8K5M7_TARER|nr:hypothetical protein QVD17_30642 [Tagetes erecta]